MEISLDLRNVYLYVDPYTLRLIVWGDEVKSILLCLSVMKVLLSEKQERKSLSVSMFILSLWSNALQ